MKHLFYKLFFAAVLLFVHLGIFAQAPFTTISYVDINNINAAIAVHGDMWWDPSVQYGFCEFPKGSGHQIASVTAVWMSGYDTGHQLHVAAQTYRQDGNDYWPGPLDANDTLTYQSSQGWAKIWKVNQTDINTFRNTATHTTANTPVDILHWPAKGNPYAKGAFNISLVINQDMAPFVDVNSDGIYDPLQGDYPAIKGDQTLWWIFSDNGPTHTQTKGSPLKVEIHAMAYAYSRGTLIDNVIYYEYDILNKSANNYNNFRVGLSADLDIGSAFDDYTGFDSLLRLGITYNGRNQDMTGPRYFDSMMPTVGVTMIQLPGDNAPNAFVPLGSFMFYYNDGSGMGYPATPGQFNNYLRSTWKDSSHLVNNFSGYGIHSNGHGTGPDANYIYPGDPSDTSQWSECASKNMLEDSRFVIASNDFTLNSGSSQKVVLALVTTNPILHNGCPNTSFDSIKLVADTAWNIYYNPLPASVQNMAGNIKPLHIYPNPAYDKLYIETDKNVDGQLYIYNSIGQPINILTNLHQSKTELDVSPLPAGLYYILYRNATEQKAITFIKE